ncbi:MAG: hypothetical protein IPG92_18470 [Flavobacteriales bacterium]|nr:hypothetical protein [Flavobacteriales bacterium]
MNINGGSWVIANTLTNTGVLNVAASRVLNYSLAQALSGTVSNAGILTGTLTSFTGPSFTNNGSVTLTNLPFAGSTAQTLNGTGSITTLRINNANGVTLGGDQTVTNALTLTNGKVTLGSSNLFLSNSALASLVGGNATNHFITNGTGSFQRMVATGAAYPFPITNGSSYMPATLTLTSGPSERFAAGANGCT